MRIGIVCYWFNRGQATVGRHLRSIFDAAGHETYVLARPTREAFVARPGFVDRDDVWDQPGVTAGSTYDVPVAEYEAWARGHALDLVFTDQNLQFDALARLRAIGVRTAGRFVWEAFSETHVDDAVAAFDVIYSLTRCEQQRYRRMGIDSPFLPWGCHGELVGEPAPRTDGRVRFLYPGGYLSRRKPTELVVEAFRAVGHPDARLVVKAQHPQRGARLRETAGDPRIEVIVDDLPLAAYRDLMAGCDVCLAPSRWEGLGLHLYEATGLGMPLIVNDDPPMNEIVRHDDNGLLVPSRVVGATPSGVPSTEPDLEALAAAIAAACDPTTRVRLAEGSRRRRAELAWDRTVEAFEQFAERIVGGSGAVRP